MLPDVSSLAVFVAAGLMLNFTPGPDMLYVMANSIGGGKRNGVVAALGIGGGAIVHTAAAALGLSAILMSSAVAFDVVRYAGAAYLVYLGVRTLIGGGLQFHSREVERQSLGKTFRQGVTTNVLNPKVALFFLAFIPQFVDPTRGSAVIQFAVLGTIFNTTGTLVNCGVALISGQLGSWLSRSPAVARGQKWFTGSVFIALGARLAIPDAR